VRFWVRGYEPRGWEFESLRTRHKYNDLATFEKSLGTIFF